MGILYDLWTNPDGEGVVAEVRTHDSKRRAKAWEARKALQLNPQHRGRACVRVAPQETGATGQHAMLNGGLRPCRECCD